MAVDKLAQLVIDIIVNTRRARFQLKSLQKDTKNTAKKMRVLSKTIGGVGLAVGGFFILNRSIKLVTGTVAGSVTAFAELESHIINIEKIAKTGNINKLNASFIALAQTLPGISFKELAGVMEASARLGIRGKALLNFSESAAVLAQVSGDLGATESAESLGRLVQNLRLSGDEALLLAARIDALSDAFPVTSGQILRFSTRLAGFAEAINISSQELVGFGAFIEKTGLTSTIARTFFIKLFNVLTAKPLEAAAALKLTTKETRAFIETVTTNQLAGFSLFIELLQKLSKGEQQDALIDLGIASSRIQQAITTASASIKDLDEALRAVENPLDAINTFFDKQALVAQSAAAQITELKDQWLLLRATIFESQPVLDFALGFLSELSRFSGTFNIQAGASTSIAKNQARLEQIDIEIQKAAGEGEFNEINPFKVLALQGERERLLKLNNTLRRQQVQLKKALQAEKERQGKEEKEAPGKAAIAQQDIFANQNREFLASLEPVLFGLSSFSRNVIKINQELADLDQGINAQTQLTDEVVEAYFNQRDALKSNLEFIKKEEEARKAALKRSATIKDLGVAGEGGKLVQLGEQFSGLIEGKSAKDASPFLKLFVNQLTALQNTPNKRQFVGLTEVWKQAQISTNKQNPLEKEKLQIARKALEVLTKQKGLSLEQLRIFESVLRVLQEKQGAGLGLR